MPKLYQAMSHQPTTNENLESGADSTRPIVRPTKTSNSSDFSVLECDGADGSTTQQIAEAFAILIAIISFWTKPIFV